jgi:lipid-binding SYLF domain-containing protein
MKRAISWVLIGLLAVLSSPGAARAEDLLDARQLVEKARIALDGFATDPVMGGFRELIKRARAVLIVPGFVRAAFILGVAGGNGVLVAQAQGDWSPPAFYRLGGASVGLQAGGDASDVVLLVMSNAGLGAFRSSTLKLGLEASIAAGPIGAGMAASTAALSVDIVQYSRSRGLYVGVSIDGSLVSVREDSNVAYYGQPVTPVDILIRRSVTNPGAAPLLELLARLTR